MNKTVRITRLSAVVVLVIALCYFSSCVKNSIQLSNASNQQWNPNIALPIVNCTMSIGDIITSFGKQGYVQVGANNACVLIYKGSLYSVEAQNIIQIPTQTAPPLNVNLTANQVTALNAGGAVTMGPFSQVVTFNTGTTGPQIDSILFSGGILTDSIVSTFQQNISIVITIPSAKNAGVPFSQTINLIPNGAGQLVKTSNVNLSGYTFDMTQGGTTNNQFAVNYTITVNPNPSATASTASSLTMTQVFKNPIFHKFFGYLGQEVITPAGKNIDTVALSIFKNSTVLNAFTISNPNVEFIISNTFGVPVQISFSSLRGFTPSNTNYPITGVGVPTNLLLPMPPLSQLGSAAIDSFGLNNTNSNIATVVNSTPQNLIYQLTASTNPAGKAYNYVLDTSKVAVNLSVKIPLYGTAKNFTVMDTIKAFSLNLTSKTLQIQSIDLRATVSNGFPVGANVQLILTDSLYHPLDSLLNPSSGPYTIAGANVNASGIVTGAPTTQTSDFIFTGAHITNIMNAKRALVRGVVSTTANGTTPVQLYSNYQLGVKIGVQSILNISANQ